MKTNVVKAERPSAGAMAVRLACIATVAHIMGTPLANSIENAASGTIVLANDSLLRTSTPIEQLTLFAAGYQSMTGNLLVKLRNFLAPDRPTPSRIFRLTTWNENEPWETVDYNKVKRGILGDFPEVRQQTASESDLQGFNRGLTIILDRDQLRDKPELQTQSTKWLIDLLNRASILEAMALLQAGAVNAGTTWDSASNPDLDLRNRIIALANTTGFYPKNVSYGDAAHLVRSNAYESQLTAGSIARAPAVTEEQLSVALGVERVLVNAERYQSTATAKQEIIGQNVLIHTALEAPGPFDASNLVRHVFNQNMGAGEYAVYMTDLGIKKVAITVENYELLHMQHTTGIMFLAVAA